jgi:nucleoside-diphosphate-sugar epimerase
MRVFVTGATGFIGSAVVKELLDAGHEVVGLARSEKSGQTLAALGARVHIGSIEDLEGLRMGAAGANAAIHLAFFHKISHVSVPKRLRILFGGSPAGMVSRFTATAVEAEVRAIETLGGALTGSDRVLVAAFPTMALAQGRLTTERDAPDAAAPGSGRAPSERAALSLSYRGIRTSVVRLPPPVHDERTQGLATLMTDIAKKKGASAYVADGQNRWPAVHRLDAARLFRLAMENGAAGARYHAIAEESIPLRVIAESIGRQLNVPVVSKTRDEAARHFGWLAPFVSADNPVSSELTQERLGWKPVNRGLLEDLIRPIAAGRK